MSGHEHAGLFSGSRRTVFQGRLSSIPWSLVCTRGAPGSPRRGARSGHCAGPVGQGPACHASACPLPERRRLLGRVGGGHAAGQQPCRGRDAAVAQPPAQLCRHGRRACRVPQRLHVQPCDPGGRVGAARVPLLHDPLPGGQASGAARPAEACRRGACQRGPPSLFPGLCMSEPCFFNCRPLQPATPGAGVAAHALQNTGDCT